MVGEMNYEYSGLSGDASEFAGKNIKYLSKKYGTPVIVYNMARIMENIRSHVCLQWYRYKDSLCGQG
jgi:diaminopimelate decarboxylase (EC 4.1.1.20)